MKHFKALLLTMEFNNKQAPQWEPLRHESILPSELCIHLKFREKKKQILLHPQHVTPGHHPGNIVLLSFWLDLLLRLREVCGRCWEAVGDGGRLQGWRGCQMLSGRVECEDKSLPDVCSAEWGGTCFPWSQKMIYITSVGSHKGPTSR